MHLGTVTAATDITWPDAAALLGVLLAAVVLIGGAMAAFVELRKTKLVAGQRDDLRQLVRRYEHLAENALDAQQRVATDVAGRGRGRTRSNRSCGPSNEPTARIGRRIG